MTLNLGILGLAHGHGDLYCARWRERPELGIRPLAAWDHDPDRARRAAEKHQFQLCGSPDELVRRPDIDAVLIAAETAHHADLVETAASAGKPIALQKPIALTLDQADRIVAAVQRTRTPLTLAWQMRVDPQNIQIRQLLHSGILGRIFMVRRRHGLATHTWPRFDESWHVDPALNRDIWADDASHPIDFLYWLLGMPAGVTAELASLLNPRIPNDNGIAILRYPDGLIAEIVCSFTCVAAENSVEIIGENGTIIQNYGDIPSCNVPRPDAAPGLKWYTRETGRWTHSEFPSPKGHGERLSNLAGPLAEFFHGRRPPIGTAAEARDVLRIVLATYDSAAQGKRILLD